MTLQNLYLKAALLSLFFMLASILSYAQVDTVVIEKNKFEEAIVLIAQGQNAARMLDSVKAWYVELRGLYEQSQSNLASCLRERDTAHAYITTLRTQISKAWTDRDKAIADAEDANNRKKKAFGIGISTGYNPFTRSVFIGPSIHWSLVRFSLRGLFDNNTKAASYNQTIYSPLNH